MHFRTSIIQFLIDINERIFFYPRLRGFYSAKLKKKNLAVIDVGSNKGQSIDFFCKINKGAMVFGFEPNRKLFMKLTGKYRSNPRIRLYNTGISNQCGELVFHENILDETSTFQEINNESVYLAKKARVLGVDKNKLIVDSYHVEVTTLNLFLTEHPDIFFDVLKIDVEGHEFQSLQGLFNSDGNSLPIRYIQIESHYDDMYLNTSVNEIEKLLNNNGFNEVTRFKHGFGDFYEIIYENRYFA
jgi:FkbM family methyltransferase